MNPELWLCLFVKPVSAAMNNYNLPTALTGTFSLCVIVLS